MGIDETKAFALAARNLALAEQYGDGDTVHVVAPCSACYLVLLKAQKYMAEYQSIGRNIRDALNAVGMKYEGRVTIRHPLDVLVHEIGLEKIRAAVSRPLEGMKVGCYYGCQVVRPFAEFDNQHNPTTMDDLVRKALRGRDGRLAAKTRCCGGMLTGTIEDVGLRLSYMILNEAEREGSMSWPPPARSASSTWSASRTRCPAVTATGGHARGLLHPADGRGDGAERRTLGLHRLFIPLRRQVAAVRSLS